MTHKHWGQLLICMVTALFRFSVCVAQMSDEEYAKDLGYDPEEAYRFGIKIQEIVEKEDLQALFSLVEGELEWGPRKKYIRDKSFSEVFSKTWKEEVLREKPGSWPMVSLGFSLGHFNGYGYSLQENGLIWCEQLDGGNWKISVINGAIEEPKVGGGWTVNGQLLPPNYFAAGLLILEHFYYELHEYYSIADPPDQFFYDIGKYLGSVIPLISTNSPAVALKDSEVNQSVRLEEDGCVVTVEEINGEVYHGSYAYEVIENLAQDLHVMLAPHVADICREIKLIAVYEYCCGYSVTHACIYGLFESKEQLLMVPLRNFDTLNAARNFVDDLQASRAQAHAA